MAGRSLWWTLQLHQDGCEACFILVKHFRIFVLKVLKAEVLSVMSLFCCCSVLSVLHHYSKRYINEAMTF